MSHNVETLAFVNELPWHGLGKDLSEIAKERPIYGQEFRQLAEMDWTMSLWDILRASDNQVIEGFKSVIRDSDGADFGIVGSDYRIIQPSAIFGIPDELVAQGLITYEVAGSLLGGKLIFALAKMAPTDINRRPEWTTRYGEKDRIQNYLLWSSRNDGNGCRIAGTTRVRVVCQNTYDAATRYGFGDRTAVQHRGNVEARIIAADRIMLARIKATEEFQRYAQELADTKLSVDGFKVFASEWLDEVKGVAEGLSVSNDTKDLALLERRIEKRNEQVAELVSYFVGEKGTGNIGLDKADAYNGVTEWIDHQKRRYSEAGQKNREGFFQSAVFGGRVMKAKGRALNLLRKA